MTLVTSDTDKAFSFNPDFFNQAEIDKLLKLRPPKIPAEAITALAAEPRILPQFELPAFKNRDAKAIFDRAATQNALDQSLLILLKDPELADDIEKEGRDVVLAKARDHFTAQLQTTAIDSVAAAENQAARESIKIITDNRGIMALEVEGTRLLEVNAALLRGVSLGALIIPIATVVFDILSLISAAIGIPILRGQKWIDRVAAFIRKIGQRIVDWAARILSKVGAWISELKMLTPTAKEWLKEIRLHAKEIVSLIVDIIKSGWDQFQLGDLIRNFIKELLRGRYGRLKALIAFVQIMASFVLMVVSGGGYLILKIIEAVILLGFFIWDTITLVNLLTGKEGFTDVRPMSKG